MITKLTKEQEEKIPQYLKKWLDIGYRTETIDKAKASDFISFLYSDILGMKVPSQLVFLDSPMACNLAINVLEKEGKVDDQLVYRLDRKRDSQIDMKLYNQINRKMDIKLIEYLKERIDNKLNDSLRDQLFWNLYRKMESQLLDQDLYHFSSMVSNINPNCYTTCCFYEYIIHELFPKKVDKFKKFTRFMEGLKDIHHIYIFDDIVFLSDFPKAIHKTSEGKLNNKYGKALEYRDGYGIYMIDGHIVKDGNL